MKVGLKQAFLMVVLVGFVKGLSMGYEGGSPGPPSDDLCDFTNSYELDSDLIDVQFTHSLFETDVLIPGVLYEGKWKNLTKIGRQWISERLQCHE